MHHFNLDAKLEEAGLDCRALRRRHAATCAPLPSGNWAVHNYEDPLVCRGDPTTKSCSSGTSPYPAHSAPEEVPSADDVLGHFHERLIGLEEQAADGPSAA